MIDSLIFNQAQGACENTKRKPQKSNDAIISNLINRNYTAIDSLKKSNTPKSKNSMLCKLFFLLMSHQYDEFKSLIDINKQKLPQKYISKLNFDHFISIGMYLDAVNISNNEIDFIRSATIASKLCFCLFMLSDIIKLQEQINKCKELFPDIKSYFDLYFHLANKKYQECIEIIDEKLQESLLSLKVFCLMKLNQFESAADLVSQCLDKNNSNEFIWNCAGIIYYELGNYYDSFYCFSILLRFQPDKPEYLFNLLKVYEKRQNFQVSEKILKKINRVGMRFDTSMEMVYPLLDLTEADLSHYSYLGPYFVVPKSLRKLNSSSLKMKNSSKSGKNHKKIIKSGQNKSSKKNSKTTEDPDENYFVEVLASLNSPVKRLRNFTTKSSKHSTCYKKSK